MAPNSIPKSFKNTFFKDVYPGPWPLTLLWGGGGGCTPGWVSSKINCFVPRDSHTGYHSLWLGGIHCLRGREAPPLWHLCGTDSTTLWQRKTSCLCYQGMHGCKKEIKNIMKEVEVARFGPIIGHNRCCRFWEAFVMPPGPTLRHAGSGRPACP